MEKLLYIGPDLAFMFSKRKENLDNAFYGSVKAAGVKLTAIISFTSVKAEGKPTECQMNVGLSGMAGETVSVEAMGKAVNCLTIHRQIAGEVCCQAFLNGFLDGEF